VLTTDATAADVHAKCCDIGYSGSRCAIAMLDIIWSVMVIFVISESSTSRRRQLL